MDVEYDAGEQIWSLSWQGLRLRIRLLDGTLLADYFGPAPADGQAEPSRPGPEVFDALTVTRAAPSIRCVRASGNNSPKRCPAKEP